MKNRRAFLWIGLALVAALLAWWLRPVPMTEVAVHPSPDGKYRIVLYRVPMRVAMPGQGGDAAGVIRLVDASGRTLQEMKVPLIREVQPPVWEPRRVSLPMIVDWPLPE